MPSSSTPDEKHWGQDVQSYYIQFIWFFGFGAFAERIDILAEMHPCALKLVPTMLLDAFSCRKPHMLSNDDRAAVPCHLSALQERRINRKTLSCIP
jgi:hypothetical protein